MIPLSTKGARGILVIFSFSGQINFTFSGDLFSIAVSSVNVSGNTESGIVC